MGEYLNVASNIKGLREKLGLNQRQFAEKIGAFSADYLRKIERGDLKEPKYLHLLAIAQVCNCSVDYILTGKENLKESPPQSIKGNDVRQLERRLDEFRHELLDLKDEVKLAKESKNAVA